MFVVLDVVPLELEELFLDVGVIFVDVEEILHALVGNEGEVKAQLDLLGVVQLGPLGEVQEFWKEAEESLLGDVLIDVGGEAGIDSELLEAKLVNSNQLEFDRVKYNEGLRVETLVVENEGDERNALFGNEGKRLDQGEDRDNEVVSSEDEILDDLHDGSGLSCFKQTKQEAVVDLGDDLRNEDVDRSPQKSSLLVLSHVA